MGIRPFPQVRNRAHYDFHYHFSTTLLSLLEIAYIFSYNCQLLSPISKEARHTKHRRLIKEKCFGDV